MKYKIGDWVKVWSVIKPIIIEYRTDQGYKWEKFLGGNDDGRPFKAVFVGQSTRSWGDTRCRSMVDVCLVKRSMTGAPITVFASDINPTTAPAEGLPHRTPRVG